MTLQPGPARITFENKSGQRTLPGLWLYGPDMDNLLEPAPAVRHRDAAAVATRRSAISIARRRSTPGSGSRSRALPFSSPICAARRRSTIASAISPPSIWCAATSANCSRRSRRRAARWSRRSATPSWRPFRRPIAPSGRRSTMREAMRRIKRERGSEDLALNIGLHAGPCLAVTLDERQDYFGLSVNVASRVQGLARADGDPGDQADRRQRGRHAPRREGGLQHHLEDPLPARRQRSVRDFRDPRAGKGGRGGVRADGAATCGEGGCMVVASAERPLAACCFVRDDVFSDG